MKRGNSRQLDVALVLLIMAAAIVIYLLATRLKDIVAPPPKNIVEVLADDGRFTTLLAAVEAAGLADDLGGEGPLTGLCPTNAAFEKLANDSRVDLATLLADRELLTAILTDHVAAGNMTAADLSQRQGITSLQGTAKSIVMDGHTLKVNNARVTEVNIEASNGVVHIIDTVFLPVAPPAPDPPTDLNPAVEVWQPYEYFQPLGSEIEAAELVPGHPAIRSAIQELAGVLAEFQVQINTARTVRLENAGEITYFAPASAIPSEAADRRVLGVVINQGQPVFFTGPGPYVVLALAEESTVGEFTVGFMDANFETVASLKAPLLDGQAIDDLPSAAILYGTRWCSVWHFCWPCGGFGAFNTRASCLMQ